VSIVFRCRCGRSLSAGEEHAGLRASCPGCGGIVIVPTPPAQRGHAIRIDQTELRQTAPTAGPVALPPASPPVAPGGPAKTAGRSRPHTMKANRRFAGKTCSICQSQVQLGEEVHVCNHCELPFHLACWEENNGCGTYGCEAAAASGPKQPYADFSVSSSQLAPGCAQLPPPLPAPQYGAPPQAAAFSQVRTSGMAVASLVLGLLWVYWIGSLLAVVFGHVALSEIDRSQGRTIGRGMAVAGLVLGYVGLGLLLLGIISQNPSRPGW